MAWKRIGRTLLEPLAAGGCTVWRLARRRDMPTGHSLEDMADDVAEVIDGLKLTGYFLDRHVAEPRAQPLPTARGQLMEKLAQLSARP